MKLKLSISRKVGAPGYGSDGASAEVEVEIEGTPTAIQAGATIWYTALEQAVAAELARLRAAHPQPQPAAEPAPQRPERPPAWRPEPGWDDAAKPQTPKSPPNGRSRGADSPPESGRQLLGWAHSHGKSECLMVLAKSWNLGRILDWGQADVRAAYRELNTQSRATGSWEER